MVVRDFRQTLQCGGGGSGQALCRRLVRALTYYPVRALCGQQDLPVSDYRRLSAFGAYCDLIHLLSNVLEVRCEAMLRSRLRSKRI